MLPTGETTACWSLRRVLYSARWGGPGWLWNVLECPWMALLSAPPRVRRAHLGWPLKVNGHRGLHHGVVTSPALGCWDTLSTTGTSEMPQQLPAVHFARLQAPGGQSTPSRVETEPVLTVSAQCWAAFPRVLIAPQGGAFRPRGRGGAADGIYCTGRSSGPRGEQGGGADPRTATPWLEEGPRWLSRSELRFLGAMEPPSDWPQGPHLPFLSPQEPGTPVNGQALRFRPCGQLGVV